MKTATRERGQGHAEREPKQSIGAECSSALAVVRQRCAQLMCIVVEHATITEAPRPLESQGGNLCFRWGLIPPLPSLAFGCACARMHMLHTKYARERVGD